MFSDGGRLAGSTSVARYPFGVFQVFVLCFFDVCSFVFSRDWVVVVIGAVPFWVVSIFCGVFSRFPVSASATFGGYFYGVFVLQFTVYRFMSVHFAVLSFEFCVYCPVERVVPAVSSCGREDSFPCGSPGVGCVVTDRGCS